MEQIISEIKPEFLGITAVNSFAANNSSPRMVMFFNHFSQRPSLLTPDSKLIKSGIEFELAKYIDDVRTDEDCLIRAIIPRYANSGFKIISSILVIIEYEKEIDGVSKIIFDCIDVPYSKSQHNVFGYTLNHTDFFKDMYIGQNVPKETILATTNSYKKDGSYGYGVNANVAFMSTPEVSEDGFVVSKSFVERLKITTIETRTIYVDKDSIPLNLYGDNINYKIFPDIGDDVRPDGLLCAIRPRNDWFNIADLNNEALNTYDTLFDNLTYVKINSKVIDIKVIKATCKKNEYSDKVTEQLDTYANLINVYYKNVVNTVTKLQDEKKAIFNTIDNVVLSPKLHRLVTDMMMKIDASNANSKIKICHRKIPINQYKIDITVKSTLTPNLGYKLTCIHAGKGVICKILDDKDMPKDINGNIADVIVDPSSTGARMNIGRLHESYLGSVSRDNKHFLINTLINKYQVNNIKDAISKIQSDDIIFIFDYLKGLYSLINPEMEQFITSLNNEEIHNHIVEVLTDNMYLYYKTDNKYNIIKVIDAIENSKYKPTHAPVTYTNIDGMLITTKENIRIGNMYIMILEKVADDFMAVASSKINNYSFPVKSSNIDKHKYPHSLSPTKSLGETEVRIFNSYMSAQANAELMDMNTNPNTHKLIVKNILETNNPMSNLPIINRQVNPYGQNKSLLIFKHISMAFGCNFKYKGNKK